MIYISTYPNDYSKKLFQKEQTRFEEYERVINLILQKFMIYIESKDDSDVIRSIEKMECNLALLTKAYYAIHEKEL